jgi:hypothetical protein
VPAQERGGLHKERGPAPAGEEGAQGCQQGAIGVIELRPVDLAAQDGELVAEHQDLDVFGVGSAEAEDDEPRRHARLDTESGVPSTWQLGRLDLGLRGTDDRVSGTDTFARRSPKQTRENQVVRATRVFG